MTARLLLPELVALAGGVFVMGNNGGRADERPARLVTVAPFRAAVAPVSNAEYAAFVAATGHEPAPFAAAADLAAPELPVVGVSWLDAIAYCEWLASESGVAFRLPTEAEREFAARGGLEGADWPWGDAAPEASPAGPQIAALERPHVPGPACANAFGLRCLADNVHEWCSDWYASDYYTMAPAEDPRGPASGSRRASRGGSWRHAVKFNRVSARSSLHPAYRYNDYGFRVFADAP